MSSDPCELSPQARAFSTVLTAFVGSIINGLTSGFVVAFITGWISWLATFRILSGALISLYRAFSSTASIPDETIALEERGLIAGTPSHVAADPQTSRNGSKIRGFSMVNKRLNREVTVLGCLGWVYTAIYSPVIQILWLVENWTAASGSLKIVRGLGISVSALGLTIDTKKRYASKLKGSSCFGGVAGVAFNLINSGSAFAMGAMSAALLVQAAIDLSLQWYLIVIYCFFSVVWAAVSFGICPVRDGGIKGGGIILDVLVGAFAGIFLAAPAFGIMMKAQQPTLDPNKFGFITPDSGSASLRSYLSCESVAVWQKMVAVLP